MMRSTSIRMTERQMILMMSSTGCLCTLRKEKPTILTISRKKTRMTGSHSSQLLLIHTVHKEKATSFHRNRLRKLVLQQYSPKRYDVENTFSSVLPHQCVPVCDLKVFAMLPRSLDFTSTRFLGILYSIFLA